MKKITLLIVGCLLAGVALAGPRPIRLYLATVPTNAAATVAAAATTNANSTIGYVNAVYLNLGVGDGTPDIDIDVLAVGALGSIERTIFSADDVAADAEHYVRAALASTAGAAITDSHGKIPIFAGDRIVLRGYDSDVTNVTTLAVYVYLDDLP